MGKCSNPQEHANHICQLKVKQLFPEVKKLKVDAMHFCGNCEAPTNDPTKVCDPKEYKGKPNILKWK